MLEIHFKVVLILQSDFKMRLSWQVLQLIKHIKALKLLYKRQKKPTDFFISKISSPKII